MRSHDEITRDHMSSAASLREWAHLPSEVICVDGRNLWVCAWGVVWEKRLRARTYVPRVCVRGDAAAAWRRVCDSAQSGRLWRTA